jgi:protein CpxP
MYCLILFQIKEVEVFRFFKSVRKICTIEQQEKFDEIMNEALKGDRKGPPREGRVPLPPR